MKLLNMYVMDGLVVLVFTILITVMVITSFGQPNDYELIKSQNEVLTKTLQERNREEVLRSISNDERKEICAPFIKDLLACQKEIFSEK